MEWIVSRLCLCEERLQRWHRSVCKAISYAVGSEGLKKPLSDRFFFRRDLSGDPPYRQSDSRIEFFVVLCFFWGRLMRGSRAGESQLETGSCPARGF